MPSMDPFEILRLIAATTCGAQLGAFLLLSLMQQPLLSDWPRNQESLWLFQRLYRLNLVLSLLAGILAIFGQAQQVGFMLAILGMSYVIAHMHLLRAIRVSAVELANPGSQPAQKQINKRLINTLNRVQQLLHLLQVLALMYFIYRLSR